MEIKIQIIVRIFILAQLLNVQSKFIAWHIILLPMPGCKFFSKVFSRLYSLPKWYHLKCNIPCTLEKSLALDEVVAFSLKSWNNITMILSSDEILHVKYPCVKCLKCGGTHWKRTSQSFSYVVHSFFIFYGMEFIHLSYFKCCLSKLRRCLIGAYFLPPFLPPPFIITYSWILSY